MTLRVLRVMDLHGAHQSVTDKLHDGGCKNDVRPLFWWYGWIPPYLHFELHGEVQLRSSQPRVYRHELEDLL